MDLDPRGERREFVSEMQFVVRADGEYYVDGGDDPLVHVALVGTSPPDQLQVTDQEIQSHLFFLAMPFGYLATGDNVCLPEALAGVRVQAATPEVVDGRTLHVLEARLRQVYDTFHPRR